MRPSIVAGLLALGQRRADARSGEKKAPMPAPAARIRSARLPCGTTSSSILPVAVEPVEDPGVGLARERADHLAHPALGQQRGQSGVAVAGVVGHDGQVGRALIGSARRSGRPACRPCRTRRPARSSRPRSRRPPRPAVSQTVRSRDVLQHHGERLADADADRGDAPPVAGLAQPVRRACRGSGRRTRRAGGRSRSRRPWCSRSPGRSPTRRRRPATAPRTPR